MYIYITFWEVHEFKYIRLLNLGNDSNNILWIISSIVIWKKLISIKRFILFINICRKVQTTFLPQLPFFLYSFLPIWFQISKQRHTNIRGLLIFFISGLTEVATDLWNNVFWSICKQDPTTFLSVGYHSSKCFSYIRKITTICKIIKPVWRTRNIISRKFWFTHRKWMISDILKDI